MVPGRLVKSSDIAPGDLSKNPCGERNWLAATLRDEAVFLATFKITAVFEPNEGVLIEARDVCSQTVIVT